MLVCVYKGLGAYNCKNFIKFFFYKVCKASCIILCLGDKIDFFPTLDEIKRSFTVFIYFLKIEN